MPHTDPVAQTFMYQCCSRYLCIQNLPTMEMNSGSLTQHYCLRRPTGTWWQVDYIGLLSFWKSQWFILTEIDTYSDIFSRYRCDFPAPRVLANTTMYGFPEGLILRNRTLHKLAFHQMSYCNVEVYQICLITGVSIVFLRFKYFQISCLILPIIKFPHSGGTLKLSGHMFLAIPFAMEW